MTSRILELETAPRRIMPAWLTSIVFHFSAIVIVALTIQAPPREPVAGSGNSLDIVFSDAGGEGDLFDGEGAAENDPAAAAPPTAALLAALPNEPARPINAVPPQASPLIESATSIAAASPVVRPQEALSPGGSGGESGTGIGNARGPGRGRGEGNAHTSAFGVQGDGKKFLYLFDRSSSMDGAPLAAAKRQLLDSLTELDGVHQFHIIFFNTKLLSFEHEGGGRRIAFADDRNKQLAATFVGGVTADGGTDRLTALREAIRFAPDVIFFLTDADDPMAPSELADIARENGRAQAAICVIEFGRRQAPMPGNFLAELARQSGGQYGYVNTTTLTK